MRRSTGKIEAVEGIRGIACLMVFLSHLSSTFAPAMHTGVQGQAKTPIDIFLHNTPFAFWYSGVAAVGIFFVLSGFILSFCVLENDNPSLSASKLAVKRYFRLMLPALFSCIIAYVIFSISPFSSDKYVEFGEWARNYRITEPSIYDAVYNGTIGAFFSGSYAYNWSLWTMKVELIGSFCVLFICTIANNINFKKTLVIICAIIPFLLDLKQRDDIYFSFFILGALVYMIQIELNAIIGGILFACALYLCGYHTSSESYRIIQQNIVVVINGKRLDNYILFNCIGGLLFVFSVLKTQWISKIFSSNAMVFMGALSFSVYLIHQPVMHITTAYFYNKYNSFGHGMASLIASAMTLIIVYLLSYIFYKKIDISTIKVSNKIQRLVFSRVQL